MTFLMGTTTPHLLGEGEVGYQFVIIWNSEIQVILIKILNITCYNDKKKEY